jgi:hypothetical protein
MADMMLIYTVALVAIARADAVPLGPPKFVSDPVRREDGPTPWGLFRGTVVATGHRSLTVDGTGEEGWINTRRIKGRKHLTAWGPLSWGLPVTETFRSHLLAQVQLGDRVAAVTGRIDGRLVVISVRIERRPGGKIPVFPNSNPHPKGWKLHEWLQAQQDFEERSSPIPKKFIPPPDKK